ncbi:hypothetical protein OKJ48_21015 [Streptomyces kunmingensis]|uniref:Secreted protein n=1 Tax=Streptomyces kunmingensis TaxID=68225 RepID=A0ABU6CDB3_9ACTN|nr:hypothetical protein [Streptomyces kunmingensis]MEB3962709.1 hypothetical protein [Streptomyces kunmingensis]
MRKRHMVAGGFFAGVLAVGLAGSPASAADGLQRTTDTSVGPDPSKVTCVEQAFVGDACFQPHGEWFWLQDTHAEGEPVAIEWDYRGIGGPRSGVIYNDRGVAAGWTNLNKSFDESGHVTFSVCNIDLNTKELSWCSLPVWSITGGG